MKSTRFSAVILVSALFTTVFGLYPGNALLIGNVATGTSGMVESVSPLHVEGGKILDANNNSVWLQGINFQTWIYDFDDGTENANGQFVRVGHLWTWTADKGTSWDTSTAEGVATEQAIRTHFQEIKSWGLNCVRFHFSILPWINDANRTPVNQYRYHLKRCAEIAAEVGIYVIYDAFEYKQHALSSAAYPFYPYDSNAPSSFDEYAFADWWGEVAAYFGDAPNVLYEIYNEPHEDHDVSHAAEYSTTCLQNWQRIHNKAVAKIRETGSLNLVIAQYSLGLDGWFSPPVGVSWIFDYPLTGTNIVYSAHIYRYYNHLGMDQPSDRATIEERLTQMKVIGPNGPIATDTAPLLIGEIGAYGTDANEITALANLLDIFKSEGVNYAGFEWGWQGRPFSMLQNVAMMAPPNAAGQILKDAGAPTGSIVINGGAAFSTSTSVTLSLTYTAYGSAVSQVRYGYDGVWDTENWETPAASKEWTLTSGDGTKTVHYQVQDNAGLVSSTYSDAITLDTSPPQGSIQINSGATYTNVTTVGLSLYATDAGSGVSQMRFQNEGGAWSSWESYATSKSWTLMAGDGAKNVYVQYQDLAGLTVTSSESITLDMTLPVSNAGQNQNVQVAQSVAFNGSGSTDNTGIAGYLWDFGEGSTGSGVAPMHSYSSVGNYTVTLMVKDMAGNGAASNLTVTVDLVIPEFPSSSVLVLFFMMTSASALVFKGKRKVGERDDMLKNVAEEDSASTFFFFRWRGYCGDCVPPVCRDIF